MTGAKDGDSSISRGGKTMVIKTVRRTVDVTYCDICKKEIPEEFLDADNTCVKCNKDICNKHIGQNTEDGSLCTVCSKKYKLQYYHDGSVALIDKKTRKEVSWG